MKKQPNAATFDLVHDIFIDENKKSISEETDLIPEIIARQITDNESEVSCLINRAEIHFHHSKHFRDSITTKGNKGRNNLYMFMAHWLMALKLKKRKSYTIYVDNSIARAFNLNIDNPSYFCFADSKKEAIQKMKESDFAHKEKAIINIQSF